MYKIHIIWLKNKAFLGASEEPQRITPSIYIKTCKRIL